MKLKELIKPRVRDERLVNELNKIYAVGFQIFSAGMVIAFYYEFMRSNVAFVNDLPEQASTISPIVAATFFIAEGVGIILMMRKGITDTGRFNEVETFPLGFYALQAGGLAVGVVVLTTLTRVVAEYQLLGAQSIHWGWGFLIGIVLGSMVFVLTLAVNWLSFRAAKRRQKHILNALDNEE
ncbi:MAG: DUF6773 family protein [Raoultibacter sp.]